MARKTNKKLMYFFMLVLLMIGITIGLIIDYKLNPRGFQPIENKNVNIVRYETTNINNKTHLSYIKVPAVDSNGNGVITNLVVESVPGSGKTLVDIDSILFIADTQSSIRTAKDVASKETGLDLNKYDLIFHIDANASVIGGPSAGAAITIATIASLENQKIKDNVMITGGINHDGTISPVGGILDKAKASKSAGADLFLVPLDQKEEIVYENREYCKNVGLTKFCSIEQIPKKITITDQANITVVEVGNITEAYRYFVNNS